MTDQRLPEPAQPGDVLDGRYRLVERIGQGGMGAVWKASDDALGRTVAVKIFAPGTARDDDAARRDSEKRLLASVNHPSLVTLFDAHLEDDGRPYLVMEYIDGGTLADLISAGPISRRDAASVAAELGEGLHVVHGAGIVHRDIKPANILLRPPLTAGHTFRAVLADFGIAYLLDTARVTAPGTAIGTAAYISPEQVRGHAPTTASDIYSLGLVLLESLSGKPAFPHQTPVEAISVRLTTPPEIPGDWGSGWQSLLRAMTEIDPLRRPTALEVSVRGGELDRGDADEDATRVMTSGDDETRVIGAPAGDAAPAARPTRPAATAPTKLLASPTSAATAVLPGQQAATGPTVPPRPPLPRAAKRPRRAALIGGSALAVAAVVVALAVWANASATPDPPPALPALEQPLDSSLQNLLEQVSP